jgi:tetratricopeptide (TPR) repeat protein
MQSNPNQQDEDDEENVTVKKQEEIDPYFVDEELLQSQHDTLTDEEKDQKLAESQNLKQLGNDEFKNEDYQKALDLYTQALRICPLKFQKERSVFHSNRSACYFKLKENEKCVKECSKSIELDPSFVKPLLRRAECNQLIDKLDDALNDYKQLSELEPRNMSHTHKCFVS